MDNISGVYEILNKKNGKRYIGSSKNIYGRWRTHQYYLRRGDHHSPYLQKSWNKYGEELFELRILLVCKENQLVKYEQKYLDRGNCDYNISQCAEASARGVRFSDEHKRKLSEANKGKPHYKARGRKMSEEAKRKLSIARKGRDIGFGAGYHHSEETKRKLSEERKGKDIGFGKGYRHSEETKRKMSKAQKGKNHPYTVRPQILKLLADGPLRRKQIIEKMGKDVSSVLCDYVNIGILERVSFGLYALPKDE